MQITGKKLLELIPQAEPFVMIDTLLHSDNQSTKTRFTITGNNVLCRNGIFTEAGLIENMAQTAAAGAGYSARQNKTEVKTGFIGAIKNLEISKLPEISQTIETEIIQTYQLENVSIISAKVELNKQIIAKCEMKIFLIEKP